MTPGIYDMTDAEYFAAPGVSQSMLSRIANERRRPPNKRAMLIGSALDTLVFDGPDRWDELYVVSKEQHDMSKKPGKAAVAKLEADTGCRCLRPNEWAKVEGMYSSLRSHLAASRWLKGGVGASQVCIFAMLEGVLCKGKLDRIHKPNIVDLKSSGCLNSHDFRQSIIKFWYDAQAAMYTDLARKMSLRALQFINVVVSSTTPHPVWIVTYTEEEIEIGRRQYQSMLAAWRKWNATTDQE